MKKISIVLSLILLLSLTLLFASCGTEPATSETQSESSFDTLPETSPETVKAAEKVNFAVIKGPTGVGAVHLMDASDAKKTSNDYTVTLAGSPDEVVPMIVNGSVDIAALPTNVASVLYQKTNGGLRVLAVNTLGVLSILENGASVHEIADLAGKTIYTTGQGANPEYILRYVLSENDLDPDSDVTVEFVGTNDELVAALVSGRAELAMVPEPAATTVMSKVNTLRRAINMTDEWDKISDDSRLMMGCVVVRAAFLDEHPDAVRTFLEEYAASVSACEDLPATAKLCEKHGVIPSEAIALDAIPGCHLVCVTGDEMKTALSGYYKVLFDANPASIGGKLPDDSFYYGK